VLQDDYVLEVRMFELRKWPVDHPTKGQLEALEIIMEHTSKKEGSTVIQDRYDFDTHLFACFSVFCTAVCCVLHPDRVKDIPLNAFVS